jgi:hypothetical protein
MKPVRTLFKTLAGSAVLTTLAACASLPLPSVFGKNSSEAGAPPSAAAVAAESVKATLARARADLISLQADPTLAAYVPVEIADAEQALKSADASQYDAVTGAHQVYVAARKVDLARAHAEVRQLSAKVEALRTQRDALNGAAPASP